MEPDHESQSIDMHAEPAVLRATIHITRKATGVTETFELVGRLADEPEKPDGDNAPDRTSHGAG